MKRLDGTTLGLLLNVESRVWRVVFECTTNRVVGVPWVFISERLYVPMRDRVNALSR